MQQKYFNFFISNYLKTSNQINSLHSKLIDYNNNINFKKNYNFIDFNKKYLKMSYLNNFSSNLINNPSRKELSIIKSQTFISDLDVKKKSVSSFKTDYIKFMNASWLLNFLINNSKISISNNIYYNNIQYYNLKRTVIQIFNEFNSFITNGVAINYSTINQTNTIKKTNKIKGLKINLSGRLSNKKKAMAATYSKSLGKIEKNTISSKISYAQKTIQNKFGCVGIKIWINYS